MKVGVNYTPSQGWFHSWLDLDRDAVARDLSAIADLGLDHVRIFPLWPLLQPHRGLIRQQAILDVITVVRLAAQAGLEVWVDVLNGHLSSFDYLPAWVNTWHRRNLFTHPEVVAAQADLVRALAGALRSEPGALGLGLGNEFSQFAAPRHPERHPLDSSGVPTWLTTLLGAASDAWPEGQHTHSYDDDLWFEDSHPFLPRHAVEFGAQTTVHSWVFSKSWQRYASERAPLEAFTRYLLEIAAGWSPDRSRAVWLQEVGAPTSHIPAADGPDFLRGSLTGCLGMPNLSAVTWWCSHDVQGSLHDFPELEHSLGLFDSRGKRKPIANELRELLPELRADRPQPQSSTLQVELAADGSDRSRMLPEGEVFAAWYETYRQGVPAQICVIPR